MRELARERTEMALTVLEDIAKDRKANARARVAAAIALLDRGWGKAPLVIDDGAANHEGALKRGGLVVKWRLAPPPPSSHTPPGESPSENTEARGSTVSSANRKSTRKP